jgi:branched-subunit amino acid ABC-type transport system permease component
MRWKMLLLSALVAAISGAGLTLLVVFAGEYLRMSSAAYVATVLAVLLAAAAVTSGVFAYRHTARRRALHGLLASTLTALVFVGFVYAYHRLFESRAWRPSVYQRLLGD